MKQEVKEYLDEHAKGVTATHSICKAVEELNELATALMQMLTKKESSISIGALGRRSNVIAEIADVKMNLYIIEQLLRVDNEELDSRQAIKIQKLEYIKNSIKDYGQL